MPGTIGTFSGFTSWQGKLPDAQRRTALLPSQAGIDGTEVARDAYGVGAVTISTAIDVPTLSQAATLINAYRKLMDATTGVIVVEPVGWTWDGVIVLGVSSLVDRTVTGQYRISTTWRMLPPVELP